MTDSHSSVTPCAGVWIEIRALLTRLLWWFVTPCAGVWIEIGFFDAVGGALSSLPVRECGLKFKAKACYWDGKKSLPVRECGLKYQLRIKLCPNRMSLPVRECGLKWLFHQT